MPKYTDFAKRFVEELRRQLEKREILFGRQYEMINAGYAAALSKQKEVEAGSCIVVYGNEERMLTENMRAQLPVSYSQVSHFDPISAQWGNGSQRFPSSSVGIFNQRR